MSRRSWANPCAGPQSPTAYAPTRSGFFNEALSNRVRYGIFGAPKNAAPTAGLSVLIVLTIVDDSFADIRLVRAPNQTTLGHRDRLGALIPECG